MSDTFEAPRRKRRWLPIALLAAGIAWGQVFLVVALVKDPSARNLTLTLSIQCSGLYSVLLYLTRRIWLPWASQKPVRNATIFGIANAGIIETLFLVIEKLTGATGVAAHPNLFMDLVLTWPWYMGMVWIFTRVQVRQRFSAVTALFLCGLYEMGSDGLIGGILGPAMVGKAPALGAYAVQLLCFAVWDFIPVYSSMILPSVWIIAEMPEPVQPVPPAWRDALKPLLWLIPFIAYLGVVILIIGVVKKLGGA